MQPVLVHLRALQHEDPILSWVKSRGSHAVISVRDIARRVVLDAYENPIGIENDQEESDLLAPVRCYDASYRAALADINIGLFDRMSLSAHIGIWVSRDIKNGGTLLRSLAQRLIGAGAADTVVVHDLPIFVHGLIPVVLRADRSRRVVITTDDDEDGRQAVATWKAHVALPIDAAARKTALAELEGRYFSV